MAGRPEPEVEAKFDGPIPNWDTFQALKDVDFNFMVRQRQKLKAEIDAKQAQLEQMNENINAMLMSIDQKVVMVGTMRVYYVEATSPAKLDEKLLLQLGVDADIIKAAKRPGNPYMYVQVKDTGKGGTNG